MQCMSSRVKGDIKWGRHRLMMVWRECSLNSDGVICCLTIHHLLGVDWYPRCYYTVIRTLRTLALPLRNQTKTMRSDQELLGLVWHSEFCVYAVMKVGLRHLVGVLSFGVEPLFYIPFFCPALPLLFPPYAS